ncbi:DUF4625 domain-containing protein [Chryseolinea sp. T2]|uniref:DUF4625 domain-containing protein n=1 Tax=Chryseolinea sp. T2 TaxID=3129255 RepID=UPI00307716D8
MKVRALILVLMLPALTLCSSEDSEYVDDVEAPSIRVVTPLEEHFYKPGDTIFIRASFSDDHLLRTGSVHIHDQFIESPRDTVFVYQFRIEERTFELDTFWIANSELNKNYDIYMDATDYAENYEQTRRTFYVYHE